MNDKASTYPFFVYIIESPSANDLYHKISEAELINGAVSLNRINCASRCVINKTTFLRAINNGLKNEMKRFQDKTPFIHISCHGAENGIYLSSGEVIPWDELSHILIPINKAINKTLVVLMSCCEGFSGIQMAMQMEKDIPFFALVGTPEKPTWSETLVGFSTFYHQMAIGAKIKDAVNCMNIASGHKSFLVKWGEETRQGYIDYLNSRPALKVFAQSSNEDLPNVDEMNELEKLGSQMH